MSTPRGRFKKAAAVYLDPIDRMLEEDEKTAATHVGSFDSGGGGFSGGMPKMPPASVGGGMGGAKIVGGWGGGGGKLTGSRAGSTMVGRHQANMMVQGMMQQNDFAESYASALGRMSRGHARIKSR